MAHPLVYPKKIYFYPVGNTPAVSLTQHLPPEEDAEALLLGCGDVRHFLHTVHNEKANTSRLLDLTCCDWEPAVLARNTLLLTMLADGMEFTTAWSIFYHIFIDDASFHVLIGHCNKLLSYSSDMYSWNASPYGHFVRFCDQNSLKEIRQKWQSYVQLSNQSIHDNIKTEFVAEMKKVFNKYKQSVMTSARSAGPLIVKYLPQAHQSYDYFWTHGMVKSPHFVPTRSTKVNPTFVYTSMGNSFNVHYGTDPLTGFHLASAGLPIKNSCLPQSFSLENITAVVLKQFSDQCDSFRARLRLQRPNVVLRIFCGETLAFCRALLVVSQTRSTRTNVNCCPWKSATIHFDDTDYAPNCLKSAPVSFNLIDTSNLSDHIGLLNVLVSTVPLLQSKPFSKLSTNILVSHDPNNSALKEKACADLPTLSLLLGVAPTFHLSHTTSISNKHELLMGASTSARESSMLTQRHELLEWRIPDTGISNTNTNGSTALSVASLPICDSKMLAQFLFPVYLKMFSSESLQNAFKETVTTWVHTASLPLYTRESFVALLAFVKGRVDTDWDDVMDRLLRLIESDRSLMLGPNNFQDLACHLYLRNIFTYDPFRPQFIDNLKKPALFQQWTTIPPVVFVVLKVPRSSLSPLEASSVEEIGTPFLECETGGKGMNSFQNCHSGIYAVYGRVTVSGVGNNARATITEDEDGQYGRSPLIVSFYLPSWILVTHADTLEFGLRVKSTPQTAMKLLPKLGLNMRLFSACPSDANHVYIVRERPGTIDELSELRVSPCLIATSLTGNELYNPSVIINFTETNATAASLTIRHTLIDEVAKKALRDGATVTTHQAGNCFMQIYIQGYKRHLLYPFPVVGGKSITRVARKSSYVEVQVPIRRNFDGLQDLTVNPFPVMHYNGRPCLFNIPYVQLGFAPKLDVSRLTEMQWLSIHLGMMMSESERYLQKTTDISKHGPLINLKQSIAAILAKWCGFESPQERFNVFGLKNPAEDVGIYTLIFVNDLQLDLSSHTVVGDACVVPITEANLEQLMPLFQEVSGPKMTQIITYDDEMHLWRRLLPAFVERCRTWKHKGTCEYLTQGIPCVIDSFSVSPLCSCGLGKDLGPFTKKREYAAGFPYATRIAIGPIFTHSFMDDIFKKLRGGFVSPSNSGQAKTPGAPALQCGYCEGPGKPTLLTCSVCKKTKYCSSECQRRDWKQHKQHCKA